MNTTGFPLGGMKTVGSGLPRLVNWKGLAEDLPPVTSTKNTIANEKDNDEYKENS